MAAAQGDRAFKLNFDFFLFSLNLFLKLKHDTLGLDKLFDGIKYN